jgi:cGMP-dependent protein kinase 2
VTLTEGTVLGGGAFSRVSIVTEETTGRQYALKRMRKSAVVQCPEHVFCEQTITRNTAHPFCIRQYGSFQVRLQCTAEPVALLDCAEAKAG